MIKKAEYSTTVSTYVADKLIAVTATNTIAVPIDPDLGVKNAKQASQK